MSPPADDDDRSDDFLESHARQTRADEDLRRQSHRMAGVGFEFVAAILLLGAAGWALDWWLGSSPWGLILGLVLGFAVGLWQLIRVGMRSFKQEAGSASGNIRSKPRE